MADLLYSEVEEDLRGTVRALLTDRCSAQAVLARTESAEPYDGKLTRTLAADLGCAGLAVPEELGGHGASWRETAVVLEELGRAVAPVPFLGSAVIATATLLACADSAPAADLLRQLAGGTRTAALAVPFAASPYAAPVPVTGPVSGVADALPADVLLVLRDDGLYAVDAAAAHRTPVVSLDMTRQLCDVDLAGAPGELIAPGNRGAEAVTAGLTAGAALLASEQLGLAEWCLQSTVEYVKTRHQFARPIGSFQALKHRLADVWVEVAQARAVARYAAGCLSTDDADTKLAAALAQAHCSATAVRAAEECIQLHGGIGFTWEHPAHLYLKRAKASALAVGTADQHRAAIARFADLPPAPIQEA
jgi:alkylation response protein AidB-like acyl-CoA dehydrogenase